jgi:hypothetical protein
MSGRVCREDVFEYWLGIRLGDTEEKHKNPQSE